MDILIHYLAFLFVCSLIWVVLSAFGLTPKPKNTARYPITCVAGMVLNDRNELLIGFRPADNCWCIPGGKIDWMEPTITAAAREIEEETGLKTEVVRFLEFGDDIFHPKDAHFVTLAFQMKVVGGELGCPEPEKFRDAKWVPLDQVPPLFAGADRLAKLIPQT